MSRLRIVHVGADGLAPFAPGLAALEGAIRYPVGETDAFTIDHGSRYAPFFTALGDAHFLVALDGDDVVGSAVGVVKNVRAGARDLAALYVCDLKVAPAQRGRGLARRLLTRGLGEIVRTPSLRRARLLYGAAMKGARGDVMRSATRWNPLRLGRPLARCAVYFAPPSALRALAAESCPPPPAAAGLDLSPSSASDTLCSTAGRKDLRLVSTGKPWPLVHIPAGPASWTPTWGHHLRRAGEALAARGAPGPACFAIDDRLADHVDWLARQGVQAEASFTVYGFSLGHLRRALGWVHLATSEV
jgi:hypothetical protein